MYQHRRSLLVALAAAHLAACGEARAPARGGSGAARSGSGSSAPASADALDVDDFGDSIQAAPARRIVSLNPSTTEILFAIGAGDRLVGRSRWDLYPDSAAHVPDVGDALRPNVESVLAVRPDVVVLYASNDNRDAARRLRAAGVRTLGLKADRIADFERTVTLLGRAAGEPERARAVVDSVRRTLDAVRARTAALPRRTVFWPLWDDPLYVVGGGSFLNDLVEIAGARNVYAHLPQPSPAVSAEDVLRRDPDVLLASPAAAARYRADPAWRSLRAVRTGNVVLFDTSLTARPGVRLGEAAESLARLLHPAAPRS